MTLCLLIWSLMARLRLQCSLDDSKLDIFYYASLRSFHKEPLAPTQRPCRRLNPSRLGKLFSESPSRCILDFGQAQLRRSSLKRGHTRFRHSEINCAARLKQIAEKIDLRGSSHPESYQPGEVSQRLASNTQQIVCTAVSGRQ